MHFKFVQDECCLGLQQGQDSTPDDFSRVRISLQFKLPNLKFGSKSEAKRFIWVTECKIISRVVLLQKQYGHFLGNKKR